MNQNKTKEEILADCFALQPILSFEDCILQAMQTYADQNGEWQDALTNEPKEGEDFEYWDDNYGHPVVFIDYTIGMYKGLFSHYRYFTAPVSNQGPTKVQLIKTIAERDRVIRELEAEANRLTIENLQLYSAEDLLNVYEREDTLTDFMIKVKQRHEKRLSDLQNQLKKGI